MFRSEYLSDLFEKTKERYATQPEFLQAVEEFFDSMDPIVIEDPEIEKHSIMERLIEAERIVKFKVTWVDDHGKIRVNRAYRVQFNSVLGPYKGGLRFHPSVNESILKFLGFEQTFKNSLTGLPMGGGKGGSDFNPRDKSDQEIMRFCQNFMQELFRHIGPNTDVPAGDIGVGYREIGYLYGMYRKLRNESTGVLTGKGLTYGGSLVRKEATGFGVLYFVEQMLKKYRDERVEGKKVLISGAGKVAMHAAIKARQMGATVVGMSDVNGYIYHKNGLDITLIANLTKQNPEFSTLYRDYHSGAEYGENPTDLWSKPCDIALPCATQNELPLESAKLLVENGCYLVCEGANMPTTLEAIHYLQHKDILFAPGKAANAGGVAVSGFEMSQNAMHQSWSYKDVDEMLKKTMKDIFKKSYAEAKRWADPRNLVVGANVAGFMRVYEAIVAQGVI